MIASTKVKYSSKEFSISHRIDKSLEIMTFTTLNEKKTTDRYELRIYYELYNYIKKARTEEGLQRKESSKWWSMAFLKSLSL